MRFIDLHTHTHASDGTDSPSELVKKAAQVGLCAVAITDHDTTQGLDEAVEQGKKSNVEVIRGCEISTSSPYGEVHILGLWLPENVQEIEDTFLELRQHRAARNEIIVKRLNDLGLDITYEEVVNLAQGETIGRPHIARILLEKKYVKSIKEAFEKYLGADGKAFEPKKILSMEDAVSLLYKSGATVSMAHPGLIKCPDAWLEETIIKLKDYGLSALEAYHTEHREIDVLKCISYGRRHGLDLTGGSDYHGTVKPHVTLGFGYGKLRIPAHLLDILKEKRKNREK